MQGLAAEAGARRSGAFLRWTGGGRGLGGERAGRGWLCESNGPRHESEVRARHGDRRWSGGVGVRGDSSRRTASEVASVLEERNACGGGSKLTLAVVQNLN